jgi:hypothetical protein
MVIAIEIKRIMRTSGRRPATINDKFRTGQDSRGVRNYDFFCVRHIDVLRRPSHRVARDEPLLNAVGPDAAAPGQVEGLQAASVKILI